MAKLWTVDGTLVRSFIGSSAGISSVAFSPDGLHILTANGDSTAKLWTLAGEEVHTFSDDMQGIETVKFSPNGKYVITEGPSLTKLWSLDGYLIQTFSRQKIVFSPNSKYLLTKGSKAASLFDLQGYIIHSFEGHTSSIFWANFTPGGEMIYTKNYGGKTIRCWDLKGGELQPTIESQSWDANYYRNFDGKYSLTHPTSTSIVLSDLQGREIQTFEGHDGDITSGALSPDGHFILTGSLDGTAKLWNLLGQEIQSFKGHTSEVLSVDFSRDGQYVLTASSDYTAKLWDLKGREMKTLRHAAKVSFAHFSFDGKYVLTCSGDQGFINPGNNTIKLWSFATGQELATLVSIDSADWVVTTPSGLFDASRGAMKLMYYLQGLEVIELDQLKERYYEPGLLTKIMGFDKSPLRNVSNFDQVALYPEIKADIEKDQFIIQLTERNGGLGKLSLFINGKEVQEDINPNRLKNLSIDLNTFTKYYRSDTEDTLALRVYNQENWLKSQAYELPYLSTKAKGNMQPGKTTPGPKTKPSLYALAIGTSKYAGDHHLDLSFADLDAEALAKALQDAGSALFTGADTHVRALTSTGKTPADICTKINIQQAFKDIAAKAKPEDVVVVFFSGHGLAYGPAEKEQFYYLTKDIGSEKLDDKSIREAYAISSDELTKWLTEIPAQKQVMIIDACNAGKVVESLAAVVSKELNPSQIRALDRMKDRTGMFILTGSAKDKVSYEASQYGQGLLTYSLLQGMSGPGLKDRKNVDVMTLFQYACDKVPELAQGIGGVQTPVLAVPDGGASFEIGIIGPGVKISVAQEKPMFTRSNFQDENFGDALGLVQALEDHFRQITVKGAKAELIYVDVNESENAYSIRGNYAVKGDVVEITASLFKGKTPQGQKFQVTGTKSDLPGLVEMILNKVKTLAK